MSDLELEQLVELAKELAQACRDEHQRTLDKLDLQAKLVRENAECRRVDKNLIGRLQAERDGLLDRINALEKALVDARRGAGR